MQEEEEEEYERWVTSKRVEWEREENKEGRNLKRRQIVTSGSWRPHLNPSEAGGKEKAGSKKKKKKEGGQCQRKEGSDCNYQGSHTARAV